MFRITFGKGFHIVFDNGITLSTQFGYGNYCDNNNKSNDSHKPKHLSCDDCEIAIWDKDKKWITKNCLIDLGIENDDDVLGRVNMDRWLKILDWCKNYKQ